MKNLFTKGEYTAIWIAIAFLVLMMIVFWMSLLTGCANKDWYIHLRAKPEIPVDLTIGRGKSHTVQTISTEDDNE